MTCDSLKSSNYITLSNFNNIILFELFSKFTAPIFEGSSTSLYYLSSMPPLIVVLVILNIIPQIVQINKLIDCK